MYLQVVRCIENGLPLLIENLPEEIDAVLMPVVGKQIIKRGQRLILKLGDLEVDYDPKFRCVPCSQGAGPSALICSCAVHGGMRRADGHVKHQPDVPVGQLHGSPASKDAHLETSQRASSAGSTPAC